MSEHIDIVHPTPVPTSFVVTRLTMETGEKLVMLTVATCVGQGSFFMTPERAKAVGEIILNAGILSEEAEAEAEAELNG